MAEARAAAAVAGLAHYQDKHAEEGSRARYREILASIAEGLRVAAGGDREAVDEAIRLALDQDMALDLISTATTALWLARAWMVDPGQSIAEAAMIAEAMTAGSASGLAERRLRAIAILTRWEPADLRKAMELVPTGVVNLGSVDDGPAVAREILAAAASVVEAMG